MQCNRKLALVVLTKIDSLFFYHIIGYLVQNTNLIQQSVFSAFFVLPQMLHSENA